jgi:Tol biopolymer transport system component
MASDRLEGRFGWRGGRSCRREGISGEPRLLQKGPTCVPENMLSAAVLVTGRCVSGLWGVHLAARRTGMKLRSVGVTVCLAALAFASQGLAGTTALVSVSSAEVQGLMESTSHAISADGRYVAFESKASNLVPGDSNGRNDIFVRDRQAGTTERVSVSSAGVQGNNTSGSPSISADGRYVAFQSFASNLVAGDTNGSSDIFVRDRLAGTTARVSVNSAGTQGNVASSSPAISADGQYVAFDSVASNLVADDTNGWQDVFVHDRGTGATARVSVSSEGEQGNRESSSASISANGRYIAFSSLASNLVAGDTNGVEDVFVRDCGSCGSGTTERVSVSSAEVEGNAASGHPSINADLLLLVDGRYVAFESLASNLVPGEAGWDYDIYVRDRVDGTTERVSVSSTGEIGNLPSTLPSISAGGRYVAFESQAYNLVPGDTNGYRDVFVRDRGDGTTERVSVSGTGEQGSFTSALPSISLDGGCVAFSSLASNLVLGDANGYEDVFVRDQGGGAGGPTANFSASPMSGTVPLTVVFTDLSTGGPAFWSWDFGDGSVSTEQNPSHVYAAAGSYTVSLTAANFDGSDTEEKPGFVQVMFPDAGEGYWAVDYILACVNAGVVGGYSDGTYRPSLPVTRDAMAVFVSRSLAGGDAGVPAGPATPTFSDVGTGHWAYRYVEYCSARGVVGGYADGYHPNEVVNRAQMAVFVSRAMAGGDANVPPDPDGMAFFPDVPSTHWAYRYVEYCHDHGVVGGYGDGYHPDETVNRAQMAVYIQRAFELPM